MSRLNRRALLQSFAAVPLLSLGAHPGRKPNFIIILADDMGYGDIGCYGNSEIQTPHLDALARGGLRFTDFHSSCPVCSPTRAGLLTGRYQQRCQIPGVVTVGRHRDKGLPHREITFAEALREEGYATGLFGKWHLGYKPEFNPIHQGFDRFRGYVSGNVDYHSHVDQSGVHDWWNGDEKVSEEGYVTHLITDYATQCIDDNHDRPFCLYLAHESPHYPYQGPDDPRVRTAGGEVSVLGKTEGRKQAYKEMIEELDRSVGAVMNSLKEHGLEEDTFVLFFSDNGATKEGSNGPLRATKGTLWEGGHRVPAIAHWPGRIQAGAETDQTAISIDVFPTLLSLAGAKLPDDRPIDGIDLGPLLFNGETLSERPLFWKYNNQRAMRRGPWKLVETQKQGERQLELFNLDSDLGESKNLATSHPRRLRSMLLELDEWDREVTPDQEWAQGSS